MDVVAIEFQPGGLGLVFDDGTSANGTLEVIGGTLYFTGLTAAQRAALQTFNSKITASVRNYDPRFGGGSGVGINNIVEDNQSPHPKLGGFLDLNGFRIYNGSDVRVPGVRAFDFQAADSGAARVASGQNAFAIGRYNTASGIASHVEGSNNTASGDYSHAEGNYARAQGDCAHAEGISVQASGRAAHAEGDTSIASGDYSHAEGARTLASGEAAHAQGTDTEASGAYSHATGNNTEASGFATVALGRGSVASLYAQRAQACGYIATPGDAQRTEAIGRITSTDQAWNEVFLDGDGGTNRFLIAEDKFYAVTITVLGYRQGTSTGAMLVRMLTIENTGGVVTLHSEENIGTDINPGTDFDVQFSASGGTVDDSLIIEVKHDDGVGPATVRWVAKIEAVEVSSPILISPSVSPSISPSPSISVSPSVSISPSISFSPSASPSLYSPSYSASPSISVSPSASVSPFSPSLGFGDIQYLAAWSTGSSTITLNFGSMPDTWEDNDLLVAVIIKAATCTLTAPDGWTNDYAGHSGSYWGVWHATIAGSTPSLVFTTTTGARAHGIIMRFPGWGGANPATVAHPVASYFTNTFGDTTPIGSQIINNAGAIGFYFSGMLDINLGGIAAATYTCTAGTSGIAGTLLYHGGFPIYARQLDVFKVVDFGPLTDEGRQFELSTEIYDRWSFAIGVVPPL